MFFSFLLPGFAVVVVRSAFYIHVWVQQQQSKVARAGWRLVEEEGKEEEEEEEEEPKQPIINVDTSRKINFQRTHSLTDGRTDLVGASTTTTSAL